MLPDELRERREQANAEALERLVRTEPYLVDVARAGDVVPGMEASTVLTSGAPMSWPEYTGGQRRAILFAAVYEGLAYSVADAEARLEEGTIQVRSTQQHGCIGSVAGIYTASMPVFVVRDDRSGGTAYCNLYEGASPKRLNYGAYDETVAAGLRWLEHTMAPVLSRCLQRTGPLPLKPLMARALRMGDELHSRNTAASLLLERKLRNALLDLDKTADSAAVREVLQFFDENDYTFLRVAMAAAKVTADAAHGVPYSSLVTAMAINCREFALRISGLEGWFPGAHPQLEGRFFEGFTETDAEWIGGESCVTETVGLGGFAQVCAPTLQAYQGGSVEAMRANNLAMYDITVGEHPDFRLPPLDFRGAPVGIDVFAVLAHEVTPVIDGGLAGRDGGQVGAGVLRPHLDCFEAAALAYRARYEEQDR